MKISMGTVKELVDAMASAVQGEAMEDAAFGAVVSYILDDVILTYRDGEKRSFMGLSFEAMGQNLHIIPTGEVLLEGEEDEDTMVVEDEEFMACLEEFLSWRASAVKRLGF